MCDFNFIVFSTVPETQAKKIKRNDALRAAAKKNAANNRAYRKKLRAKAMKSADRYFDDKGSTRRIINMRYMLKVAWVEIVYHVHHDYHPEENYVVWTLDPAKENGIAATIGSFSTWPGSRPGTTRFLYQTLVDTGRNIPEWVEEDLSESSLKSYIKQVKKRAER